MINLLLSQYNFHEPWAKSVVSNYINKNDKIAVIPFAFSNTWISNGEEWNNAYSKEYGKYYKDIVTQFINYGIKEENIKWVNYFNDTKEKMKNIIKSSDVVFLTGGLPEKAVSRVLEKDLLSALKDSKFIIGASAGAMMQLENYYISPDEDYPKFGYEEGLGIVNGDFYIEVHYEGSSIQNECIEKVLDEKKSKVYAIKEEGGILIDENGKLILLGDVKIFN